MEILASLGRGWKISPDTLVVPIELLTELLRIQTFLDELKRLTTGLDHCPQAGVGTLLIGVPAPQDGLHEEERVLKVLPKTTDRGSWRGGPWTSLHGDPHRCQWWCHSPSGWTSLMRGLDTGSQCALPSTARWLHEGTMAGVKKTYGYGWPAGCTKFD